VPEPSEFMTLVEASKTIPGRPHINTVRRWCTRGFNGVRLQSWRFGNRIVTTKKAISEFGAATTAQSRNCVEDPPTCSHQRAESALDSMGIK